MAARVWELLRGAQLAGGDFEEPVPGAFSGGGNPAGDWGFADRPGGRAHPAHTSAGSRCRLSHQSPLLSRPGHFLGRNWPGGRCASAKVRRASVVSRGDGAGRRESRQAWDLRRSCPSETGPAAPRSINRARRMGCVQAQAGPAMSGHGGDRQRASYPGAMERAGQVGGFVHTEAAVSARDAAGPRDVPVRELRRRSAFPVQPCATGAMRKLASPWSSQGCQGKPRGCGFPSGGSPVCPRSRGPCGERTGSHSPFSDLRDCAMVQPGVPQSGRRQAGCSAVWCMGCAR